MRRVWRERMSIRSENRPRNRAVGDDPVDPEDDEVIVNIDEVQLGAKSTHLV